MLPNENETAQGTMTCLQKMVPPDQKPSITHKDNSLDYIRASEDLCWNHDTSTLYRSETNGIAENTVRKVKEGTSVLLVQKGLFRKVVGGRAMECFCFLRNLQDNLTDAKSPYETRFGTPFDGPMIPL